MLNIITNGYEVNHFWFLSSINGGLVYLLLTGYFLYYLP